MAKYAAAVIVLFAIVAICTATPIGWGRGYISKNHHVSSHHHHHQIISPYMGLGLGYGMMGLGGLGGLGGIGGFGHSVSSHSSISHVKPHYGLGLGMKGLYGMYPGGIGLGWGYGRFG